MTDPKPNPRIDEDGVPWCVQYVGENDDGCDPPVKCQRWTADGEASCLFLPDAEVAIIDEACIPAVRALAASHARLEADNAILREALAIVFAQAQGPYHVKDRHHPPGRWAITDHHGFTWLAFATEDLATTACAALNAAWGIREAQS